MGKEEIIFVYNADSGIFHTVEDYIHKIMAPATYPCRLCAVTYDSRGMKKDWKNFVEIQGLPVSFLHRDEFSERYPEEKAEFPCAFLEEKCGENEKDGKVKQKEGEEKQKEVMAKRKKTKLKLFISAAEINRCESLSDLKKLVTRKVKALQGERGRAPPDAGPG